MQTKNDVLRRLAELADTIGLPVTLSVGARGVDGSRRAEIAYTMQTASGSVECLIEVAGVDIAAELRVLGAIDAAAEDVAVLATASRLEPTIRRGGK